MQFYTHAEICEMVSSVITIAMTQGRESNLDEVLKQYVRIYNTAQHTKQVDTHFKDEMNVGECILRCHKKVVIDEDKYMQEEQVVENPYYKVNNLIDEDKYTDEEVEYEETVYNGPGYGENNDMEVEEPEEVEYEEVVYNGPGYGENNDTEVEEPEEVEYEETVYNGPGYGENNDMDIECENCGNIVDDCYCEHSC